MSTEIFALGYGLVALVVFVVAMRHMRILVDSLRSVAPLTQRVVASVAIAAVWPGALFMYCVYCVMEAM